MPINGEWERIAEPNDPKRCQASGAHGQCRYIAKEGGQYCPRHSATTDQLAAKRAANAYKLQQYQERMTDFTTNSEIKNLRAEIGILRMLLEGMINQCHGDNIKLASYAGKIGDLIVKVQKLVQACQRLDIQTGMLLDRDKVMIIGQKIVEILGEHVPDPGILDLVGEKIVQTIMEVSSPDYQDNPKVAG